MRASIFFLLILIALTACDRSTEILPTADSRGNVYITATPILPTANADGVIVITATPAPQTDGISGASQVEGLQPAQLPPTVTPSPPPPVTDPTQDLARAERFLQQGYREEAIRLYNQILTQQNLSPQVRGDAGFKLGQAAVREGLFQQAVDALTVLIDTLPDHPRVPQAYFLRGDAYSGLNQWAPAIRDYEQYLALRPGLIDSYAHERIADAQFASGQTGLALASYEQALNANRSLVPQLILREKLAQIYINLGQVDNAIGQYDAILAVARNAGYRATIDMYAATALDNAGRTEAALARARRVFDNYTETNAAYDAMQILLAADVSINGYRRGIVYYNYGVFQQAIDAFNAYTSTYQLDAIPADLYLRLGRAYREIGNSQAALVAFQTLIDTYPDSPLLGDALLETGRTRFLQQDIAGAIARYSEVADTYALLAPVAAEALWRVGYLQTVYNDDDVSARDTFVRIANDYPGSEWAVNGLQIAASNAVANGQTAIAENLYGRIASIAEGEEQAAAFYWVGRLAQQQGDPTRANQAFAQARQAAPGSFFSERANDIVIGREPFVSLPSYNFTFDVARDRQQADAWLRQTFGITQEGDLSQLSPELDSDPRMIRGRELWALADASEAREEFDSLLDTARENRNALWSYQLAHYLRDIGDYYNSIVAAADVIVMSGTATLDAPPYIARMRYPDYYIDLILPQAERYGYDPLLMLALIRQESLFNAQAVSVASAKGLTQVIPSTAQYIADQLNWVDFQDSDLYRPHVGVAFGSYYLDEQLRLFEGNRAAALAAYNAGPGYTLDWVSIAGDDVDALVTTIQFDETRRYVQRIYSHYTIYRELYGA
jgi:soluble lytic murein transglycosylase